MSDELLSFTPDGFQWAWDSTSLSTFVTCPRKYLYSILQGWGPVDKSVHLIFGGHYAKALERFHKLRAEGEDYFPALRNVLRQCLTETWDFEKGVPQDWLHNVKTRETLIRSIVWYLAQYEDDPMETVILSDGTPAVELSFSFELSEGIVYCGHIDRLVNYAGGTWVQDQKTTGSTLSARYFLQYSPDYQMTGYTMAGQIIFNNPVKGVVIDAAQIAVGFTAFARGFTPRSKPALEEFLVEAKHYIAEAKKCHETGYYPMRRTSCNNYGGCPFREICAASPVHREALLQAKFTKRDRWDPLKKR